MKKIPKRNYAILFALIVVTIILTIFLAALYKERTKKVSDFYSYSNKITVDGFEEYINESQDAIIYIADKYDLTNTKFESEFKSEIDESNLKSKVVFIDVSDINEEFLKKMSQDYSLDLSVENIPMVIVIIDNELDEVEYVDEYSNAKNIIDYSKFE